MLITTAISYLSPRTRGTLFSVATGCLLCFGLTAAPLGNRVSIGGIASDIALDEPRGVLYIANFTASQIDVMQLRSNRIERSMNVAKQPSSLAVSNDGRWLVITHYGEAAAGRPRFSAVTVVDLNDDSRREFTLSSAPLGVAFGANDLAFIVTTSDFVSLDPWTGQVQSISTLKGVVTESLPVEAPSVPTQITKAAVTASGDRQFIYTVAEKFLFRYNVRTGGIQALTWIAQPDLGPRTLSVSADGSYYAVGWWIIDAGSGIIRATFGEPLGDLQVGSHVIDSQRGVVYAQVPSKKGEAPELRVLAADNLQVLERFQLLENLSGRSVLNAARNMMYSTSESGVLAVPVGNLNVLPRVHAEQTTLVFRNSGCTQSLLKQSFVVSDPGGNNTPFRLVAPKGVRLSMTEGLTPAVVEITLDPSVYGKRGTEVAELVIQSAPAVNFIEPVKLYVNNREPDQRGTMLGIPGKLVDIMSDPVRDRIYVLRQDTNQVLVFDSSSYRMIGILRTGTLPMQMAITADGRQMLVANDGSQLASVFDLDTLQPSAPVRFPGGHYPRSIGVSGGAILAVSRTTTGEEAAMIDKIDLSSRTAVTLDSLGVYKNSVHVDSVLSSTPNGAAVLVAMPDGLVMLYDSNKDTFTVARKISDKLGGSYAASNYDRFAVDKYILNTSLVPVGTLDSQGASSGMVLTDQTGFWTTSGGTAAAGIISRLNLGLGTAMLPTTLTESPSVESGKFTRTLAVLRDRSALVSLSTSGVTVLPWNYDAAFARPRILRVVNAADQSSSVAPGGLITIYGQDLSPFNVSGSDPTLADALPEACLAVNGTLTPVVYASPTRMNAQLPLNAEGATTMILRTPGGTSDSFRLQVSPVAPAIFHNGVAGPDSDLPVVIRASNNDLVTLSNPIHPGDEIILYATGLGRTSPEVTAGTPAPFEPLAKVIVAPQLRLGGVDLNVFYAGMTPGQVGVYQINAVVPRNVPTGFDIPLVLQQGASSTSLKVRVVR